MQLFKVVQRLEREIALLLRFTNLLAEFVLDFATRLRKLMRQLIALSAGERLGSRGLVTRGCDQLVFEFLEVRIKLGQTIVIRGFTSFDNRLALELNRLSWRRSQPLRNLLTRFAIRLAKLGQIGRLAILDRA